MSPSEAIEEALKHQTPAQDCEIEYWLQQAENYAEVQIPADDLRGIIARTIPASRALAALNEVAVPFDMVAHLEHQREWSAKTFGPGARLAGVLDHIRKELAEIEADPHDLKEWVDVIILAFDGAWRAGWEPADIVQAIRDKQAKNEARVWPDWRTVDPDKAIEHDRSHDTPSLSGLTEEERAEGLGLAHQTPMQDVEIEYWLNQADSYAEVSMPCDDLRSLIARALSPAPPAPAETDTLANQETRDE